MLQTIAVTAIQAKPQKRNIKQQSAVPDVLPVRNKPERTMLLVAELDKPQIRVRHIGNSRTGIDVSHYQGYIDWKKVAADNRVAFVYIKATENTGLVDNTKEPAPKVSQ